MQTFFFCSLIIIINYSAPFLVEFLEKLKTKGYRGLEKYLSKTILMYGCEDCFCFSWNFVYQVLI